MPRSLVWGGYTLPAAMILNLLVSFIILPFVKYAALFAGIVDIPRDGRRMHTRAVPLTGGIGIIASFCAVLMLSIYWGGEAGAAVRMLCLSLAAAIYGICDDIFAVKPWQKLLCQTLLAFCACLLLGTAQAFSFAASTP